MKGGDSGMSLFAKVLASVGVGAAKVDTKLEKDTYMPGESMVGVVEIVGGSTDQRIDTIYLSLNTTYERETNDKKYTAIGLIERYQLSEPFVIQANEKKEIPFTFRLPEDLPLSVGKTKIWVTTGLDIKNAVDPSDKDYLYIMPTPILSAVFHAVNELGFRLREADCEEAPRRYRRRFPFVQEFEFKPQAGPFRGKLDELELIYYPIGSGMLEILLQVDRRARGLGSFLAEALEMDETQVRFTILESDIPNLQDKMYSVIEKYT